MDEHKYVRRKKNKDGLKKLKECYTDHNRTIVCKIINTLTLLSSIDHFSHTNVDLVGTNLEDHTMDHGFTEVSLRVHL